MRKRLSRQNTFLLWPARRSRLNPKPALVKLTPNEILCSEYSGVVRDEAIGTERVVPAAGFRPHGLPLWNLHIDVQRAWQVASL
jgi:hypothetical protein